MPKGYVIITEAIRDPEGMTAYGRAAAAALGQFRPEVLVVSSAPQVLEGEWHGDQTVVLEFPSVEAAREWYDSDAYTAAKALRQAAAETNAVIVAGLRD